MLYDWLMVGSHDTLCYRVCAYISCTQLLQLLQGTPLTLKKLILSVFEDNKKSLSLINFVLFSSVQSWPLTSLVTTSLSTWFWDESDPHPDDRGWMPSTFKKQPRMCSSWLIYIKFFALRRVLCGRIQRLLYQSMKKKGPVHKAAMATYL